MAIYDERRCQHLCMHCCCKLTKISVYAPYPVWERLLTSLKWGCIYFKQHTGLVTYLGRKMHGCVWFCCCYFSPLIITLWWENYIFHFAFKWRSTLKRIVIPSLCITLSDSLLFCECLVCSHEFDLPCSCSGISFPSWSVKISSPRLRSVSSYLAVISSFPLSSYRP